MTLEELGYNDEIERARKSLGLDSFGVGRVIAEHRERYIVRTAEKECEGEVIGNLRFTARERSDYPAVGDWVAISEFDDRVLIHAVLPRQTVIERRAAGKQGEKQIIAANIHTAFIIQAVDRDFNINRIERYLTICYGSKVTPVIILNKIDLITPDHVSQLVSSIQERVRQVPVLCMSIETQEGMETLRGYLLPGQTYCLLGSSGVGKSTLINKLAGRQVMKTNQISASANRGRHVTSHRELYVLKTGGILIDNPGMREVGIADSGNGTETAFDRISGLSGGCRFKDCSHTSETGCAVIAAVEGGELDRASYENFLKIEREKRHYESSIAEKRRKEKEFGKMVKNFKKGKNNF